MLRKKADIDIGGKIMIIKYVKEVYNYRHGSKEKNRGEKKCKYLRW